MIATISTAAATWWWIGLGVVLLVVVPTIALLAWKLVEVVREIRRYGEDVRRHGAGLAEELAPVAALRRTGELTGVLREGFGRYAAAIAPILDGRHRR